MNAERSELVARGGAHHADVGSFEPQDAAADAQVALPLDAHPVVRVELVLRAETERELHPFVARGIDDAAGGRAVALVAESAQLAVKDEMIAERQQADADELERFRIQS
jgi:hypothetical protein